MEVKKKDFVPLSSTSGVMILSLPIPGLGMFQILMLYKRNPRHSKGCSREGSVCVEHTEVEKMRLRFSSVSAQL